MKKVKFIAEVCSNHNQSLKRCYKLIDEAKKLGCWGVKFQLFRIEKLFSKDTKLYKKIYRKIKKSELPLKFVPKISNYCKKKKIKFGCTPFDLESLNYLKNYVDFIKIASYELNWKELIKSAAKLNKFLIISTGAATFKEVKNTVKILKSSKCKKFSFLHCVSSYPTKIEQCNLMSIKFMRDKLKANIGWSDHSVNPLVIFDAINSFDAELIEFHFDLDKKGLEFKSGDHCWLPKKIKMVIDYVSKHKKVIGTYKKNYSSGEKKERLFKTDPYDGLRPIRSIRKFV